MILPQFCPVCNSTLAIDTFNQLYQYSVSCNSCNSISINIINNSISSIFINISLYTVFEFYLNTNSLFLIKYQSSEHVALSVKSIPWIYPDLSNTESLLSNLKLYSLLS